MTQLPKPDFGQMIPFKPKPNAFPGEHPISGKNQVFSKLFFQSHYTIKCV